MAISVVYFNQQMGGAYYIHWSKYCCKHYYGVTDTIIVSMVHVITEAMVTDTIMESQILLF